MSASTAYEAPRWLRDLVRFLPLKPRFVLSGNVRDLQLAEVAPGAAAAVPLGSALTAARGKPIRRRGAPDAVRPHGRE